MTLVAFEGIAVATVMPAVGVDLDGLGIYAWAFGAYVAASLVGMVTAGVWADRFGPRLPFTVGALIFGSAALAAGFAPTMAALIVARGCQGLGGGGLIVALYVVIARAYPEAIRPKAFSVLSAAWVIPALAGPVVAGWVTDTFTWRWAFWAVPVVMVWPLIALHRVLRDHDGGQHDQSMGARRIRAAIVAAIGLVCVQAALLRPGNLTLIIAIPIGVVGFAALLPAVRTLLPHSALRLARGLPTVVMMRGFLAGCFFSAEAFLPLALVEQRGVSVTWAGLTLAVASAGWVAGATWQSRLPGDADRARPVRWGAVMVALGLALLPLCLIPSLPVWICAGPWVLAALGMGLSFPSINVQTLRLSPRAQQGRNSSSLQISDAVLTAIGLGIAGAIHATAVATGGAGAVTYVSIWLLAALGALGAAGAAGRMTPVAR
jgi:MFS family permease